MFSITPSEAGCERNFSILKWFYGDLRTCLDISKVESMSMMHAYWMTNIKKEMISDNINERLMFHGTSGTNPIEVLKHRHGMMKDYNGEEGFYGKGIYFAEYG